MPTISGEVRDNNGDLAADVVVRAYRRDTGALLAAGLSGDGSEEQAGDPDFASVALLLAMDGTDGSTTFTDSSGTPKAVTAYGNAHIETDQSMFGGASGHFDGTGDYLLIPSSEDFDFGSNDFTIEFWFKTAQTASQATLLTREIGEDSWPWPGVFSILLHSGTNGPLAIYSTDYDVYSLLMLGTTTSHADNNWHHFAWTRASNVHRMFLDGVQEDTKTTSAVLASTIKDISIGAYLPASNRFYNGYIDCLRINNGKAYYTENFTPPEQSFTDDLVPARPLGEYHLTTSYTDEVNVIALDPSGGDDFNDLILRTTPV